MLKNSKTIIPYNDIDYEIRNLIRYINEIDGIETTCSCCGHGKMSCYIELKVESIEVLNKFMYDYFYCNYGWEVCLFYTDTDIDENNWGELKFVLQTRPDMISNEYVYLSIADVTKNFELKRQQRIIDKIIEKVKDKNIIAEIC